MGDGRIILAKGQLDHSYTYWIMPIMIFSSVHFLLTHPLSQEAQVPSLSVRSVVTKLIHRTLGFSQTFPGGKQDATLKWKTDLISIKLGKAPFKQLAIGPQFRPCYRWNQEARYLSRYHPRKIRRYSSNKIRYIRLEFKFPAIIAFGFFSNSSHQMII